MKLKIKRLHPDAVLPSYAHPGDAGLDLFCLETFKLSPGEKKSVPTGIAMEIPKGYVGLIWDKSGVSALGGIKNLGGVVDAGYRGDIVAILINLSKKTFTFEKGHKMAQLLIQRVENPQIVEVKAISNTKRGAGKFGSTGK